MNQASPQRLIITHQDLDGIGCAFLLARCFPVDDIKFVSRHDQMHELLKQLNNIPLPCEVWITDLSVYKKSSKLLINSHHEINFVDHHESSEYLKEYDWAFVDVNHSATALLYQVLSTRFNIQELLPLVEAIDNYDMWGYENGAPSETASHLNSLQLLLGPYLMLNRLHRKSSPKISESESAFIAADLHKMEQYIGNTADPIPCEVNDIKFLTVCAERYHSQVGSLLLHDNPDVEFVAMLNYNLGLVGLRGRGNLINLSQMATSFPNGGGHAKSAGFPYSEMKTKSPEQMKEVIAEWVRQRSTQSVNSK
jgi:oligoribonuclease NrnB/cAMP/cGMP phosphodiesterase (DHH superfamily)